MDVDGKSTGRTLFEKTVEGGARALALGPAGLASGASADVVSLRADHIAFDGRKRDRILDAWIFTGQEPAIDCVWVRGVKQVADGRHQRRDEIEKSFRGVMRRLAA
jgi:cytosine/adenosine deaminase-related metal-dependent hydrolase